MLAVTRFLALLLLLASLPVLATTIHTGKVVGITDGDTLTLLVGTTPLKIRLAEIDTPERGQPYGTRARRYLAFGKSARVVEVDRDRYGRIVGQVSIGDLDVNAELVRQTLYVNKQFAIGHHLRGYIEIFLYYLICKIS